MPPFLLSLIANPKLIGAILGAVALFMAGWHVSSLISKHELESQLKDQEAHLIGQCNDEKKITEKANETLQTQISDINKRLVASKRLHPSHCVIASSVAEHTASGGKYAGQDGIDSSALRDYAAECEQYRSEVILLNDFGQKNCQ